MRFLMTFISFLMSIPIFCQLTEVVDSVVVSALRIPVTIEKTGRSITIVDRNEIESFNANSIDEILQLVPGVEVQSRGAFGAQADILMRGSTFTQVMILVDGVKINDPLTGHFNGYIPVAKDEIDRIEVLRGASSAVFGPDAVGGVINIITKLNSTSRNEESISGSIAYGQNSLRDFNLGLSKSSDKLILTAGISSRQSDGQTFQPISLNPDVSLEEYNNYFDITTAGVGVAYKFNPKWQMNVRSSYDIRDFDARYFYTTSTFDKSTEAVTSLLNHLMIKNISDKSSSQIDISHKHGTDEFIFSPDFPSTNNHITKFTNLIATHHRVIGDVSGVKLGLQMDRRSIESNDRGNHEDFHLGLFGSFDYSFSAWSIIPNLRLDYDSNYDLELLPSLNIAYNLDQATFRFSTGRTIRAADYTERYVSNNLQNLTPGRSLGNPELVAEKSWSTEIGLDFRASENWTVSTTIFNRSSQDLIDYISTNQQVIGSVSEIGTLQAGENYFFASNIADVTTLGFEVASTIRTNWGDKNRLLWNSSISLYNQNSSEDIISVYLANASKLLWTNQVSFYTDKLNFHLTGLYKQRNGRAAETIGSTLSDSYLLVNLSGYFNLSESLQLGLHVYNLGDTEFQNILGAPLPKRWLSGSINWSF